MLVLKVVKLVLPRFLGGNFTFKMSKIFQIFRLSKINVCCADKMKGQNTQKK